VLERVEEDRGHEAAVLAAVCQRRVARTREEDVLVDTGRLGGLTRSSEEELVDFRLPGAEPRARSRARCATAFAVTAVVGRVAVFELERPVDAVGVAVTEHVVRARDHAPRAPRTETGGDHFFVEVAPVQLFGRHHMESSIAIRRRHTPAAF
jgi:hypothetical protein